MQDLRAARAKLQADALLAPPELLSLVGAQVGTLDDLIRRLQSGTVTGLDLRSFDDAQKEIQLYCQRGR